MTNVPTTIHTKDFGDIPVDANAEWGLLPDLQDVGFPAGDHLYCFVFLKKENPYTLGYYITTAYGSQRELESGEL